MGQMTQEQINADLFDEVKRLKGMLRMNNEIIHNMVVANQAAWIAWQQGDPEKAMRFIHNGLVGPGHIPANDGDLDAQQWLDAHSVEVHLPKENVSRH